MGSAAFSSCAYLRARAARGRLAHNCAAFSQGVRNLTSAESRAVVAALVPSAESKPNGRLAQTPLQPPILKNLFPKNLYEKSFSYSNYPALWGEHCAGARSRLKEQGDRKSTRL